MNRVGVDSLLAPGPEVLETAHNAFVSLDAEGRIVYWNARAAELFGFSREEALGADVALLIVPERDRERHRQGLARAVRSGPRARRMSLAAVRQDGTEIPVEMTVSGAAGEDGVVFHAWIQDVSERSALLRELELRLREGGPGLAEILDALAEAVTIRDPHHHIIYANRAALDHMGFATLEEMQRRAPASIMSDYIVHGEDGREITMDDIPSVRLLAGGSENALVMRTIHRATGVVHWNVLKATLLRDQAGEMVAAVTIIEDITKEKTAELRDRFLSRATETLMSSLDYQETLRNVAWLTVPEIADWCAVDLVDEQGAREQVVVAHSDPAKLALAEQLRRYDPEQPRPDQGMGRVLATGASELYADVTDEMLVAGARDEEHLRLLRAVGFRSVLLVPLLARGQTLGVMTLVTAESRRRFDEDDLDFAQRLAGRAALAVDNARLATARRQIAETLQRSLLPDEVPEIPGWEVATMYRAASAPEEIEVGGDFYDFFPTDGGWIVLLGDVTGRGVAAASMTSLVRHGARFLSKHEQQPSAILAGLDEALREGSGISLCSALCIRLEQGAVVLSSAGHPPPLIVRADGRIREIGAQGALLGGWAGTSWSDRRVEVAPDETLVMYTDGVTDTRGAEERFGARRLRRLLGEHSAASPAELLAALKDALDRFQVSGASDDTGVVALRPR